MKRLIIALSVCLILPFTASAQECPELTAYYDNSLGWPELVEQLTPLLSACLQSSEYFALLGGAQLNSGLLAQALESLERALLLNPENGAAQIDYAQALFLEGQLFGALELNRQLLRREDLPADLRPMLQGRQEDWRALTEQTDFHVDLLLGYDDNLNSAPDPDQVTLTLSGESVILPLNPEFRPQSGPYANIRLGGRHRRLAPDHQQHFAVEMRGRVSEYSNSDLLQLDGRYSFISPGRANSWQVEAGVSNLFFGGSALFSAMEAQARYMDDALGRCRPFYELALQHQIFHEQSRLNAFDSRAGGGLSCDLSGGTAAAGPQMRLNLAAGVLHSQGLKAERPGGDRLGWQLSADAQWRFGVHSLRALLNHTRVDDRDGYSPLLINGGRRQVERSFVLLQYRQPVEIVRFSMDFLVNFFHQTQASNIELFRSDDNTIEVGLSLRF